MSNVNIDAIDRKLLNLMQAAFPLTTEPYADLGQQLGIDRDKVLHRIEGLRSQRMIRRISPVLDARSLGYQTTLVAMRIADNQLERAERIIAEHPGVSHGYERNHYFNVWFTLAVPPTADMETELEQITGPIGADAAFSLPAIRLFKLAVYFDMEGNHQPSAAKPSGGSLNQRVELSETDRRVINEIQQDLPLVPRPFTAMAERLNMDVEDFLAQCRSLVQRGIMRRFGAAVNHRQAGFKANAMTCWVAPPEIVESAGRMLASLPEVSHCYERKTNLQWQYNLFAMIHSHTKEACREIASRVSRDIGLNDAVLLFSTKEFKKVRVKYLV